MKLYVFYVDEKGFQKNVMDVEERPKTYTINGCDWRQRIAKEDINKVNCRARVHLLEDAPEKAAKILSSFYAEKEAAEIKRHKDQMELYATRLDILGGIVDE